MTDVNEKNATQILVEGSKRVTDDDLKKVFNKRNEIEKKFQDGPLARFAKSLKLLFAIMQDYMAGDYREIPWFTIAAIVIALLYVLNPIDLVPDFIPVIGLVDDAAVVAACLMLIEEDLKMYAAWKERQSTSLA